MKGRSRGWGLQQQRFWTSRHHHENQSIEKRKKGVKALLLTLAKGLLETEMGEGEEQGLEASAA